MFKLINAVFGQLCIHSSTVHTKRSYAFVKKMVSYGYIFGAKSKLGDVVLNSYQLIFEPE